MRKSIVVLLVVGLLTGAVLAFFIFGSREGTSPDPKPKPKCPSQNQSQQESQQESHSVEVNATPGTKVFIKSPGNKEEFIAKAPTTVEVPIAAIIILRYQDEEQTFPPEKVRGGKIFFEASFERVSINAVPWAEVFIKPPGTNYFIEPDSQNFTRGSERTGENRNVTPIRGKMKVQVGTSIKLVYDGREKIFPYESWEASKLISHNFLGQ